MSLPSSIGSQLDGLLPAPPAAVRPPENDVKSARDLASRIAPSSMNEFFSAVRTQTHSQLEALAFVLQEEFPGRITEQVKKEFAQRLAILRTEVLGNATGTEEALKKLENRLGWVRSLLTRPATAPVAPTAPQQPQVPGFLTGMLGGLSTRIVSMFTGRPATQAQSAAAQVQATTFATMIAQAGERLVDSVIAAPDMLSRLPGGSVIAAPINFLAGLMGSTPENRRDRMMRREAERAFQAALRANAVSCAVPTIDDLTWQSLKATVQPVQPGQPTQPVNMVAMVQAWVKLQRDSGVAGTLALGSAAELVNLDALRKQLNDKRAVEQRTGLQNAIGARIGRTVNAVTNGTEVQMQGNATSVSVTARLATEAPTVSPAPVTGITPTPTVQPAGDFDAVGNPVSNEAKTLIGAAKKFPRAAKIRIVSSGSLEMVNPNEFVVPSGSFDETGAAQTNEARTLVGMSTRFQNATKLKIAAAGGSYEMINSTEFTAVSGGFAENGSPSSAEARQFDTAIRELTRATKITLSTRENAQIINQTEFVVRPTTRIADLKRLSELASDDAVQQVTINSGMLPRDIPILERRENGVELNTHPNTVNKIVEAGGWSGVLNRLGNNSRLNLDTMQPIRPSAT